MNDREAQLKAMALVMGPKYALLALAEAPTIAVLAQRLEMSRTDLSALLNNSRSYPHRRRQLEELLGLPVYAVDRLFAPEDDMDTLNRGKYASDGEGEAGC